MHPTSLKEVKIVLAGGLINTTDGLYINTNAPIIINSQKFINDSRCSSKLIPAVDIDTWTSRIVLADNKYTADPNSPVADIVD